MASMALWVSAVSRSRRAAAPPSARWPRRAPPVTARWPSDRCDTRRQKPRSRRGGRRVVEGGVTARMAATAAAPSTSRRVGWPPPNGRSVGRSRLRQSASTERTVSAGLSGSNWRVVRGDEDLGAGDTGRGGAAGNVVEAARCGRRPGRTSLGRTGLMPGRAGWRRFRIHSDGRTGATGGRSRPAGFRARGRRSRPRRRGAGGHRGRCGIRYRCGSGGSARSVAGTG